MIQPRSVPRALCEESIVEIALAQSYRVKKSTDQKTTFDNDAPDMIHATTPSDIVSVLQYGIRSIYGLFIFLDCIWSYIFGQKLSNIKVDIFNVLNSNALANMKMHMFVFNRI